MGEGGVVRPFVRGDQARYGASKEARAASCSGEKADVSGRPDGAVPGRGRREDPLPGRRAGGGGDGPRAVVRGAAIADDIAVGLPLLAWRLSNTRRLAGRSGPGRAAILGPRGGPRTTLAAGHDGERSAKLQEKKK